jgi:hypothetical protein
MEIYKHEPSTPKHPHHDKITQTIYTLHAPTYELAKHKILVSGINYLVNRLNIYPISKEAKEK